MKYTQLVGLEVSTLIIVYERSLFCSPKLLYLIKNTLKIVKYYYN